MNTLSTTLKDSSKWIMMLIMTGILSTSCSKNNDTAPETKPDPTPVDVPISVPFYQLQRVENLAAETDDKNPMIPKTAVFFSLENKKEIPLTFAKTNHWDVSFNGLYNSFLAGNFGATPSNSGNGGPGKGGILIIEKPFDEVVDIPADSKFRTGGQLIGTDDAGYAGEGVGWYLYDFGGNTVGDSSFESAHVAYALSDPLKLKNGTTLTARTLVIRTAKGNYAKLKMISCYKDAFTPDKWFRSTPHMYFTFEYVLAPKGSTRFEIK